MNEENHQQLQNCFQNEVPEKEKKSSRRKEQLLIAKAQIKTLEDENTKLKWMLSESNAKIIVLEIEQLKNYHKLSKLEAKHQYAVEEKDCLVYRYVEKLKTMKSRLKDPENPDGPTEEVKNLTRKVHDLQEELDKTKKDCAIKLSQAENAVDVAEFEKVQAAIEIQKTIEDLETKNQETEETISELRQELIQEKKSRRITLETSSTQTDTVDEIPVVCKQKPGISMEALEKELKMLLLPVVKKPEKVESEPEPSKNVPRRMLTRSSKKKEISPEMKRDTQKSYEEHAQLHDLVQKVTSLVKDAKCSNCMNQSANENQKLIDLKKNYADLQAKLANMLRIHVKPEDPIKPDPDLDELYEPESVESATPISSPMSDTISSRKRGATPDFCQESQTPLKKRTRRKISSSSDTIAID